MAVAYPIESEVVHMCVLPKSKKGEALNCLHMRQFKLYLRLVLLPLR